jgi:hypothetical protein
MFAVTSHSRPQLDFADMGAFLEHGWGELGIRVAGLVADERALEAWHHKT